MLPQASIISEQVRLALAEDVGSGDLTASLLPEGKTLSAKVVCREQAVMAGSAWFDETFRQLSPGIQVDWCFSDGDRLDSGQTLCRLQGNARALLTAERTALNFLQTLSAVATRTRSFVDAVEGIEVNILDTRKTIPGLRLAEKYAVTCGGGVNHRVGLFDAVLIKENHIAAAGSIANAVKQALAHVEENIKIEVEVESLEEMQQALDAGARYLLLDNFSNELLREAVAINRGRARLEASGNVSLQTVKSIAQTGVDDISIGELTKHIQAVDLSMRFE